jgi:hypothetical protein
VWAARDDGAPPEQWPQFVAAFQVRVRIRVKVRIRVSGS